MMSGWRKWKVFMACSAVLFLASCSGEPESEAPAANAEKVVPVDKNDIIVKATLEASGAVGYGNLYIAEVNELLQGKLDQVTFTLVILSGDPFEKSIVTEKTCRMTFHKKETNVQYQLMPITGFVDENRTSWELVSIKPE